MTLRVRRRLLGLDASETGGPQVPDPEEISRDIYKAQSALNIALSAAARAGLDAEVQCGSYGMGRAHPTKFVTARLISSRGRLGPRPDDPEWGRF